METWYALFAAWLADNIISAAFGFMVAAVIGFLFGIPQFRKMRARLDELERNQKEPSPTASPPESVDYIGACAIIDAYIEPALRDKRPGVAITIRQDMVERFGKVTGAKLGEHEYNGELLHQWMRSNAARFLVEHRGEML